jgi:MFS family permease
MRARAACVVVLAACGSGLTIGMANYAYGAFVDPLTEAHGWSRTEINGAFALMSVLAALLGPAVGLAIDRFGVRRAAAASLLVQAAGYALLAGADGLPALYAAFGVVVALGYPGASMAAVGKVVAAWFPARRGRMVGLISAGNNLGGLLMVQLSTAVIAAHGVRWAAATFAALAALVGALYLLLVRDAPPPPPEGPPAGEDPGEPADEGALAVSANEGRDEGEGKGAKKGPAAGEGEGRAPAAVASAAADGAAGGYTLAAALRTRLFYATALVFVGVYWTYSAVLVNLIPALRAEGFSAAEAASVASLAAVAGTASKLASGLVSERLTARWTMVLCLGLQIAGLATFLLGVGGGPQGRAGSEAGSGGGGGAVGEASGALVWLGLGVYGLGFGGIGALMPLLAMESFGAAHFGAVFGALTVGQIAPSLAGPLVAGALFDASGRYLSTFAVSIGVFASAILALLLTAALQAALPPPPPPLPTATPAPTAP